MTVLTLLPAEIFQWSYYHTCASDWVLQMDLGKERKDSFAHALQPVSPSRVSLGHTAGRQITGAKLVITLRGHRQTSAFEVASLQTGRRCSWDVNALTGFSCCCLCLGQHQPKEYSLLSLLTSWERRVATLSLRTIFTSSFKLHWKINAHKVMHFTFPT